MLLRGIEAVHAGNALAFPENFVGAVRRVLEDSDADPAFAAEALSLPNAGYIAEQLEVVDPEAILTVRTALRCHLAAELEPELRAAYSRFVVAGAYSPDPVSAGRRAMRNLCLGYLMELHSQDVIELCAEQLRTADNMTEAMAALISLANCDCPERETALTFFYDKWRDEPLVIDKWFSVQASSRLPDTFEQVQALMQHPDFDIRNPNRVRAVVGAFCHGNHARFNAADGSGYAFAADQVIALDSINAQIAARLARAFDRFTKFDAQRQAHARRALQRIREIDGLSKDTFEVVSNALG